MKYTNDIVCRLDLDSPGKRAGHLALSHSDDANAFGIIPVPIAVIAHGIGPTLLLFAGNHGDEYEGQVILRRLFAETEASAIQGRIILLPALNYPSMLADRRVSPLDQGNMNRSFPGASGQGPTKAIADFVTQHLFPISDAAIDFHSGGHGADFLSCAFLCTHRDMAISKASLELAEAFAAPYTYVIRGSDCPGGMDMHAQDRGVAFISTELSGGAGVNPDAVDIGYAGLRRVLSRMGILPWENGQAQSPTILLDGIDAATTVMSPITGIFEPFARLGQTVEKGEPSGRVWPLEEIDRAPVTLAFEGSGLVVARRVPARIPRGGFAFIVTPLIDRARVLAERG